MKTKIIISALLFLIVLGIVTLTVVNSNNENLISVSYSYGKEIRVDELVDFPNSIPFKKLPKNYKIVMVWCRSKNTSKKIVEYINVKEDIVIKDIYFFAGCYTLEPSYPVYPNDSIGAELYLFVPNKLTEEQLMQRLNEIGCVFSYNVGLSSEM